MADDPRSRVRRALPLAILLVLAVAVVLVLALLRGEPAPVPETPRETAEGTAAIVPSDLPDWVAEENRAALLDCRRRIAAKLGADADAVSDLTRLVLAQGDRLADFLVLFRLELDLAVRSGDAPAGERVLELFAHALERGDEKSAELVRAPGFRQIWQRALEAESPALRAAAARFLRHVGGDGARAAAIRLLDDPDATVRAAAVRTYGRLADRRGAARLRALFAGETDPLVRTRILTVFGENTGLRGPDAWAVERAVLESGSRAERLVALRNIIAARVDHNVGALLPPLLDDTSPNLRRSVLELMLLAPKRDFLPALEKHLENEPDIDAFDMTRKLVERLKPR